MVKRKKKNSNYQKKDKRIQYVESYDKISNLFSLPQSEYKIHPAVIEWENLTKELVPPLLYRYRPIKYIEINGSKINREFEDIKNGRAWFTIPNHFNDIFDSTISVDDKYFDKYSENVLDVKTFEHLGDKRKLKQIWSKRAYESINKTKETLAILCLNEYNDSALMWGHYADSHKGICLAYSTKTILETGFGILPILYSNKRKMIDIEKFDLDVAKKKLYPLLLNKDKNWSYEQEWRIIEHKNTPNTKDCIWSDTGTFINFPKPVAIFHGCRAEDNTVADMLKLCKDENIVPYRMEESQTEFKVIPHPTA